MRKGQQTYWLLTLVLGTVLLLPVTSGISQSASSLKLAFALAALPEASLAAEKPNFTGTWQLNHEQSDSAREKIQETMSSSGGRRRGGMRGGRRPGDSRGGQQGGDRQGRMREMFEAAETLIIAHNDPELSITDNTGRTRTLYTDGRKAEQQTPRGETIKVTARWQADRLVIEREAGHGRKMSETYELAPDGRQLVVTKRIENQRFPEPIIIRYVYDAARTQ